MLFIGSQMLFFAASQMLFNSCQYCLGRTVWQQFISTFTSAFWCSKWTWLQGIISFNQNNALGISFRACNCLFGSRNCLLTSRILGHCYKLNWPKRANAVLALWDITLPLDSWVKSKKRIRDIVRFETKAHICPIEAWTKSKYILTPDFATIWQSLLVCNACPEPSAEGTVLFCPFLH